MKKILSLIFIFQLILAPIPNFAEASSEDETESNPSADDAINDLDNLAESSSDMARTGGAAADNSADFYWKQVLSIANGCIGSSILVNCVAGTMQPSLYIFFAGTVLQMISEIEGASSMTDKIQRDYKDLEIKEDVLKAQAAGGSSLQRDILLKQRSKEEDLKNFAENRRNWMITIGSVYALATAVAIAEIWLEIPPPIGAGKPSFAGCTGNAAPATGVALLVLGAYGLSSYVSSDNRMFGGGSDEWLTGGLGALLVLLHVVNGLAPLTTVMYNHAISRSFTFGGFSFLSYWLAKGFHNIKKQAEANSTTIQNVINSMDTPGPGNGDGTNVFGPPGSYAAGGSSAGGYGGKPGPGGDVGGPKNCAGSSPQGIVISSDCSNPLNIKNPDLSDLGDMPFLKDMAAKSIDLANAMAKGERGGRVAALKAELAANASGIRKLNKDLEKKLNAILKKSNKPTIDFDKERKKTMATLTDAYMNASKSTGVNPIGQGTASLMDSSKNSKEKNDPNSKFISGGGSVAIGGKGVGSVAPTVTESITSESLTSGLNNDYGQKNSAKSLNKFNVDSGDISQNRDVSLFSIISNRYVRSYDRVMNKKN